MNLLITGAWAGAKENITKLEKMGHQVLFLQYERDELPCDYRWVEGVICNALFLNHPIDKFEHLSFIQLTSAGFDRIPMDYVKEHDIKIYNAKGVYSIPMAEYVFAGVLDIYKKSAFFWDNKKDHKWEKHRDLMELYGKTVVIVGCGDVGTECAKRFKAFGCKVIGVNRTIHDNKYYDNMIGLDDIDSILAVADVVVISIALSKNTQGLINKARLSLLKPKSIIVNIARGSIVDYNALEKIICKIGGAVLDVFEEEPLSSDSNLWYYDNVIITPHNSYVGDGNNDRLDNAILRRVELNESERSTSNIE